MKISVNNDELTFNCPINVDDLIESLDLKVEQIAVEINRTIVPRSEYSTYCIKENDEIEIINAVGGG